MRFFLAVMYMYYTSLETIHDCIHVVIFLRVRPCKNFHFNLCLFIVTKTPQNHKIKPLRISEPSPKPQKCLRENYGVYSLFGEIPIFIHLLKPQDSFGKKDKTFSWSAESAAHSQKTSINLPALVMNDVFSCNNVKWLNIAMYITYM